MAEESEIERLRRLLKQSRLESKQSRVEAEQSRVEAEQSRLEAKQSRVEAKQSYLEAKQSRLEAEQSRLESKQSRVEAEQSRLEAEQFRGEMRNTTLKEYIEAYHDIFLKFSVQQNKSLTSKGSITDPKGKTCPKNVVPWTGFLTEQRRHLGELLGSFPLDERLFSSKHGVSSIGTVVDKPIASEKMLELFMHLAIENPVQIIVEKLALKNILVDRYSIGAGVIFENHPSAISDVALGDDNRVPAPPTPARPRSTFSQKLRPDQICVYRHVNEAASMEERNLLFIEEYKVPHKLTTAHIRAGLRQEMDILEDIVNNPNVPKKEEDAQGHYEYWAKRLTAAAITQTYHYMIEGGVSYGILTNGEATVFLKVDWNSPDTVLYHVAEPKEEAPFQSELISCTAVSQWLSFILLALNEREVRNQGMRESVKSRLQKWNCDNDNEILRNMTPSTTSSSTPKTPYKPSTYGNIDRTPEVFRSKPKPPVGADRPAREAARRRSPSSSDDEAEEDSPGSPSPSVRRTRSRGRATRGRAARGRQNTSQQRGAASSGNSTRGEQYCTQKCLIGLVNGDFLDTRCPNVSRHMGAGPAPSGMKAKAYHPVNHATWLELLREQWQKSLDDGITNLNISGASGALFRVTMLRYGYTFIGKGTPAPLIKYLRHEAAVYKRLQDMQGTSIPVFLGTVDLRPMNKIYYYDHRVYIVHVTFFSWGGRTLSSLELPGGLDKRLTDGACQAIRAMHSKGVIHNDIRDPNMLYNPDTKRIMIIDFDRASIVEASRRSRTQPDNDPMKKRQDRMYWSCNAEVQATKNILSSVGGRPVE
ncbi:Polysialic acid O-acetyltransferase [Metarhizium anisopliae]|nr:Polysialic acid O-acetyltransferase [Metarhizium anisopliae]